MESSNPNKSISTASTENRLQLYPNIEPFLVNTLKVSEIHELYYEVSGNPNGKPVITIHGGPGGNSGPK